MLLLGLWLILTGVIPLLNLTFLDSDLFFTSWPSRRVP